MTLEETEAELKSLTGKSPDSYQPEFYSVISPFDDCGTRVVDLLRQWLILKGVTPTKAYGTSHSVLNKAYGIGDRYVNAMKSDNDRKRPPPKAGRPIDVDLSPRMFDAKVVELLNDGKTVEEVQQELGIAKEQNPEGELNPIMGMKVQLDSDQIARAAEAVINPRLVRAQKTLEDRFDTATRLVDNRITEGIDQLGKTIQQEVNFAIEQKGLGENLTNEIKSLVETTTVEALERMVPRKLEIKIGNIVRELDAEPRHKKFDEILTWLISGSHVYIVGPKGTGKTHLGNQLAQALGRNFYPIDQSLTKYDVKGYKGPTGEYIPTLVRTCVESGGLLFIDEGDMWASAALGSLNSILANDFGAFPDSVVKVHKDFICVICANTYGQGADRQYNGRNPLDAASLDRFSFVEVDYDEDLEIQLYGNGPWVQYVHRVRSACRALRYDDMIPSMRAIVAGLQGLNAGLPIQSVTFARLWKGAASDKVNKIIAQAGELSKPKIDQINETEYKPDHWFRNIRDLVIDGNKIVHAIKEYRLAIEDRLGFVPSLKEAKDLILAYRDNVLSLEQLAKHVPAKPAENNWHELFDQAEEIA